MYQETNKNNIIEKYKQRGYSNKLEDIDTSKEETNNSNTDYIW